MYEASIKAQLVDIVRDVRELVADAGKAAPTPSGGMISDWMGMCQTCEDRLEDDLLRMAAVGTIKSGKSTFINSLFSGDHLKRGAGVITSIVTKVRAADNLRAVLYFKSWGEINEEITQSLRIFFAAGMRPGKEPFDLRDANHRRWLESALENLESKYLLSNDTRNMDHVLLGAYLRGYPDVKEIVSDDNSAVYYEKDEFGRHRDFSGSEYLSAFLKDLKLEIPADSLETNIEIADCQGSDSPNPLHLAMIQDYLQSADLVVYIISSRTGLRQADITFLTMIKNMAGMSHVLFVVNADFSEHESVADLERVAGHVREELELMISDPSIYIFSSLFSLFSSTRSDLAEKDRMRLAQWEADNELVSFSRQEEKRFQEDFRKMITEQRFSILLKNQMHCLNDVVRGLGEWLKISRDVLTTDNAGAAGLLDKIGKVQQEADHVRSMIQTTMDGAVSQLKKEITSGVDKFFDIRHGNLVPGIIEFVRGYHVSYDAFRPLLEKGDFSDALFSVFQAFKQDLDRYMAENVNPVMIGFIKSREGEIARYFESLDAPFRKMIREADSSDFSHATGERDRSAIEEMSPSIDLSTIKKSRGLSVPSAVATLDYSGTLKTEAFLKLGFYRFTSGVKQLFKRSGSPENRDLPALKAGVRRVKKETEASLVFYFKSYKENIKFQYFFKLIESISEEMRFQMVNRFSGYQADLLQLKRVADENRDVKGSTISAIDDVQSRLVAVKEKMENIQESL
ncbi:MAG: dynamin family protein [Desulfosalsimonadaceae bacterium]